MKNKLVITTVSERGQGDSQEYLCLVYENSWGAGLARNQLQFLADKINSGEIVLPRPEIRKRHTEESDPVILAIQRNIAMAMVGRGNQLAKRGVM